MNKNEMSLGYYGYEERDSDQLGRIFKEVERLHFPVKKKYDIYYIDLTYASQKVVDFIEGSDAMPLIIKSHFEPAEKILEFLHEDSYLFLDPNRIRFSGEELEEVIEEYLQRFEQKKSECQHYKEHWKEKDPDPLEDVWRKWKKRNKK